MSGALPPRCAGDGLWHLQQGVWLDLEERDAQGGAGEYSLGAKRVRIDKITEHRGLLRSAARARQALNFAKQSVLAAQPNPSQQAPPTYVLNSMPAPRSLPCAAVPLCDRVHHHHGGRGQLHGGRGRMPTPGSAAGCTCL